MLVIVRSMKELRFESLAQIYGYDRWEEGRLYDYLRGAFFQREGAVYCIWQEGDSYLSAMRLEPYEDGLVLAGLATAPAHRRRGHGEALIRQTLRWLAGQGRVKVYSHIHHKNRASIAVHERCGFRRVSDHAVFLDGSVSAQAGTYRFDTGTL